MLRGDGSGRSRTDFEERERKETEEDIILPILHFIIPPIDILAYCILHRQILTIFPDRLQVQRGRERIESFRKPKSSRKSTRAKIDLFSRSRRLGTSSAPEHGHEPARTAATGYARSESERAVAGRTQFGGSFTFIWFVPSLPPPGIRSSGSCSLGSWYLRTRSWSRQNRYRAASRSSPAPGKFSFNLSPLCRSLAC